MIKDYKIFLSAVDTKLHNKSKLRVDLIGDIKISEIEEFKNFNIVYLGSSFEDLIKIKGTLVKRKVRYIQLFEKIGECHV
ncbi:hypothetical protein K5V21_18070 [Clostridium sardiniense]|uniref:Uncharacterized protein n=1 Tax=Clostridium sardiniense TaxID=29369 RepID=A0ABS7L2M9_CLOSR|nr:hypothetical protein [Clostridium sardiniense]MBY0757336.1 hypothetical protein [Clostridium sardiniense]MDQ0458508.1 hypothetical protein [Clostridium sardiniense]